jgi:hypothetical protein
MGRLGANAEKVKELAGNVARVHHQQLVGKEQGREAATLLSACASET